MATPGRAPVVVYGIAVENPQTALLVRKVMHLSAIMAFMTVISAIYSMANGSGSAFLGFLVLGIPACGYYGAKQRNRNLLQWFWGCTACCACLQILGIISSITALNSIECICNKTCTSSQNDGQLSSSTIDQHCGDIDGYKDSITIAMVVMIFDAILQCAACILGKQLSESDLFVIHAPTPPGGIPVAQHAPQPGVAGYPGAYGQPAGAYAQPAPGAYGQPAVAGYPQGVQTYPQHGAPPAAYPPAAATGYPPAAAAYSANPAYPPTSAGMPTDAYAPASGAPTGPTAYTPAAYGMPPTGASAAPPNYSSGPKVV